MLFTRHSRLNLPLLAISAFVSLLFTAPARAVNYTFTDLTLGGSDSAAFGLNNKGEVVGVSKIPGGAKNHAFFWSNGVMTDIGYFPWNGMSDANSSALAISDNSKIVGVTEVTPFIRDGSSVTALEKISDAAACTAFSISPNGEVVAGYCNGWFSPTDPNQIGHAVLWRGGKVNDLGVFGELSSYAYAVNDNGQVAGEVVKQVIGIYKSYGFLWNNGTTVNLGDDVVPWAINNKGEITGEINYRDADGKFITRHAFLYSNGAMTDLGAPPGEYISRGYSINNKSEVLVVSGSNDVYIYSAGGWTKIPVSFPTGYPKINDNGQIAGTFGGTAVLLSPVVCPVSPLPSLPANDVCAQTLENSASTEAQKEAACGTLTPAMQTAVNCFAGKLAQTNDLTGRPIPLVRTSNRRNAAYQTHFNEIWEKMFEFEEINDPATQTACAALRAAVAGEKGCNHVNGCTPSECAQQAALGNRAHCLVNLPPLPGPNGDSHTNGTAIDTDRRQTVDPLVAALAARRPPQTIQPFLDAPPACGLRWLGPPPNNDPPHFQVPR